MRVLVVTPPEPVISLQEAMEHLKLDDDLAEDSYIQGLAADVTSHLDGPEGWLGRALGLQTLEARLDSLGCDALRLPYPPIVNVISVSFVGRDGATVLDPATYFVDDGHIVPNSAGWPALPTAWGLPRVRIRYRAGYALDPDAENIKPAIPAAIRRAILLMMGDLHRFRATSSDMNISPSAIPMSASVDDLLQPLRLYS